jgi:microbial collagenase
VLFQENSAGSSTASEALKLITNMNDEAYYLPSMKAIVQRYTNSASNPKAADLLKGRSAGAGFTSALTVFFYAHYRAEGKAVLQGDASYAQALYDFFNNNKTALLGASTQYQLTDAEREAFRFMQYASQKNNIKTMVKNVLATTSMTGSDSALWLEAASSVSYYDKANCAEYGTCNFETKLADAVLKNSYTCSPSLKIRAQDMTVAQLQDSCKALAAEETYFHQMLQTNNKPVANDLNSSLELVVFDDYSNYAKYAGIIYGISTDNGGMYLEGNPSKAGNQARFIAHEASWLRPSFKVWNLEHEYVHYLDGRFDMAGDFSAGTAKPTVWWIEGVAEYLSLRNDNQTSIDVAKTGSYKLSTIFGNTYSMSDYVPRAYRWGYMATRFMNEKHRSDVDAVVAKFRLGDYAGYQNYMDVIGNRYDAEFASWVQTASTAGQPPLPNSTPSLPACPRTDHMLGKNCTISGFATDYRAYAYIMLPAGAKNLRIFTNGGTGDVNLYVALDHYPSPTSGDLSSAKLGNNESISIASPVSSRWYYVTLDAKTPFANVNLSATYE